MQQAGKHRVSVPVYAVFKLTQEIAKDKNNFNLFEENRLTSKKERSIILSNKDKHAIFIMLLMVDMIRRQT